MNNTDNNNLDTKTKIFNTALTLFATDGYENVSMRAIANAVGIKTASIYYHFDNKEEILNACYDFFLHHRHITRPTKEQYIPVIKNGTKEEVLGIISYVFPESILKNMILSLLLIFSRLYTDVRAKEVFADDINNSTEYIVEFFNTGIELGRIKPFNTLALATTLISTRIFLAQTITVESKQIAVSRAAEVEIFNELTKLIPFKY